jgi:hypothetical protein
MTYPINSASFVHRSFPTFPFVVWCYQKLHQGSFAVHFACLKRKMGNLLSVMGVGPAGDEDEVVNSPSVPEMNAQTVDGVKEQEHDRVEEKNFDEVHDVREYHDEEYEEDERRNESDDEETYDDDEGKSYLPDDELQLDQNDELKGMYCFVCFDENCVIQCAGNHALCRDCFNNFMSSLVNNSEVRDIQKLFPVKCSIPS